jgi:alkylation response protein AidB-like acyl-CoA dehydrogenase
VSTGTATASEHLPAASSAKGIIVHTLPEEQRHLMELVEGFVADKIAPAASQAERDEVFPRDLWNQLGAMDLAGLPFAEDVGGSALPYRTYLMVLEELSRGFAAFGLGLSVHTLVTVGIEKWATPAQRARFAPDLTSGRMLGGYCLSEPDAGSDAAALRCRAVRDGDVYRITGTKAWVTHAGIADRYLVFARTSDDGARGISAFVVDADQEGLTVAPKEDKMGLRASPTAQLLFEDAPVPADRLLGEQEGIGFKIAMSALDGGRLGVAAVATGLAQAALDTALSYARDREQFKTPIIDFQGVSFMLADMATQIEASRALYRSAADRRDHGHDVTKVASMSKLFATDMAMKVTTDAVQVLGGVGYTRDFPAERYMREAKVMQIFEGTNQIQRLVIGRTLAKGS